MKINMNDTIRVKLTSAGRKILKERYREVYRIAGINLAELETDYYTCQLWQLFEDFGRYIYNGCLIPFENNEIEFV